ncbi:FemAB family XrtA/PEP-CTERM system-associated protein [Thalassotalea agariperforans]
MSSIRLASAQDEKKWDSYVSQHPDATPYHRFAWLTSAQNAYDHKAIAWLAEDEQGNIIGVLPCVLIKPPMKSGKLSALPFCDVGGVIANSAEVNQQLLNTANQYCADHRINTFEHRQSIELSENSPEAIASASKVRMLLALPESAETLFTGFKSKLRSQIRKAEKNGLTSSTGRDQKHLDGFYHVFARNMRDLGSPVHSKKWFEQILANYQDNIIIANVYKDDIVVGAGIVLINGKNSSIPWASTNADYNRLAPNMLLYWSLLSYVADNGFSTFDFGRSTPGEGTYKFKQQWGAEPVALDWQTFQQGQCLPEEAAGSKGKLREIVETCWKKLPVNTSVMIGPAIRKYISL